MSKVDYTQLLRLEVEREPDPGELLNLVANPTGELGAWGWVTPVEGSKMRSTNNSLYGWLLVYTSPGGAASYYYTEPMPVTPGTYAAASWMVPQAIGKYAASFEWLDATGAVTGSSGGTGQLSATDSARRSLGAFAVPAGTAYCRLRFDHYADDGGNPPALASVALQDVTVTAAETSEGVSWQRVNLMPTPSAEGGLGGWGSPSGGRAGTSRRFSFDGTHAFTLTKVDGKGPAHLNAPLVDVTPGRDYAFGFRARPDTHRRDVTLAVRWLKGNGEEIRTHRLRTVTEPVGDWTGPVAAVATAPTNAAKARLRVEYGRLGDGEVHYVDAVMVEQAASVGTYFDGTTAAAGGVTYTWAGEPYDSASLATGPSGDPGTLVPVPYQNILGPSHKIDVDREELNVGSMSVALYDAILDPTQSDLIAQGKRIRLTTVDGGVLFAGKVLTGAVTYHLLAREESKRAEVTLSAVDSINPLAAAPRREGVATIDELPYVLEGAGVPWSVNGSGDQVPTAEVVAYNDNASALDQVAVTRDSVLGYAWVDRNGVLQVWDADQVDSTVAATLDETTYTADLDIAFDLDRIVNSVTVRVLRVIATTGATEEVTFGPYVDVDSYRRYGEHAAEYTIQGVDAADTATIQAYAQRILDVNATPRLRVNQMVLPIRSAEDLPRALLDLYDLVTVTNGRAGLDQDARVTTVQHSIEPGKWLVTLGFVADGSVASPTSVPAPPPGVGGVKEDLDGDIENLDEHLQQLNLDLTELNTVTLPQVQADLATAQTELDALDGKFPITSTSISDGAISTPKLAASAVQADKIASNAIYGRHIVAQEITGDKLAFNSISGDKIIGNTIGADKLTANAIDGKTITGATIQTSYSPTAGIHLDSSGFSAYTSSGGTRKFYINGTTGDVGIYGVGLEGGASLNGDLDVHNGNVYGERFFSSDPGSTDSAPNVFMGSTNGQIQRSTGSSIRFKEDVLDADLDPDVVLKVRPRSWYYKPEYFASPKRYYGFVAEELIDLGLGAFVDLDEEGQPENVRYAYLTAAQQTVLRRQAEQIAQLTDQVAALTAAVTKLQGAAS